MKDRIIVLTNSCFPVASAIGNISIRYIDYLKEKYDITCICIQEGNFFLNNDTVDGIHYYSITNWRYRTAELLCSHLHNSPEYKSVFIKSLYFILRGIGWIERKVLFLDGKWWYKRKALRLLQKLWSEQEFTHLFSFSSPIGAHLACQQFKEYHPKVKWVSYWGDLLSGDNFRQNIFYSKKRVQRIEERLLNASDFVFTTDEIFPQYSNQISIKNKIQNLPYLLNESVLSVEQEKKKTTKEVRFVCMGSFQKQMRDPTFMLEVFSCIGNYYHLDLYTSGCELIVQQYANKSKGSISIREKVSFEELKKIMANADVLVNISNAQSYSVPSKVFELISYKKPIIDFHVQGQLLDVWKKYPLALNIDTSMDLQVARGKIIGFVRNNFGNTVDENYLRHVFSDHLEEEIKKRILYAF